VRPQPLTKLCVQVLFKCYDEDALQELAIQKQLPALYSMWKPMENINEFTQGVRRQ
jgi:hypothetical protein